MDKLKTKGTSFDDVLAECEKDPEYRREYLRVSMDESEALILENNALRKQLEKMEQRYVEITAFASTTMRERDALRKQLEVAKEGIEHAATFVGGDYDDVSDADRMDGTERILTDALAEIERIGGAK
jgi:regulator of replication initiation timing